jgi:hypothetical protein
MKLWKILILAIAIFNLLLGGAVVFYLVRHRASSPAPMPTNVNAKQTSTYKLYYPSSLPGGYSVDKTTLSKTEEVTTYSAKLATSSDALYFSFQNLPSSTVLQTFQTQKMVFSESAGCPIGEATIGQVHSSIVASIATKETWILITIPASLGTDFMKQVVLALQ